MATCIAAGYLAAVRKHQHLADSATLKEWTSYGMTRLRKVSEKELRHRTLGLGLGLANPNPDP